MTLDAGVQSADQRKLEKELTLKNLFANADIKKPEFAKAALAGAYLAVNNIHASHDLSQTIKNAAGSSWHAIMHRREGDYWNSKYWWRQAGQQTCLAGLVKAAGAAGLTAGPTEIQSLLTKSSWSPGSFVDLVETVCTTEEALKPGLVEACLELQRLEWLELFNFSYQSAL